jgi:hypothetical protein
VGRLGSGRLESPQPPFHSRPDRRYIRRRHQRLVDRGHSVTALTTCASSYVDWDNTQYTVFNDIFAILKTAATNVTNFFTQILS